MAFHPNEYGPEVELILTGEPAATTALVASRTPSDQLKRAVSPSLFADSAHPQGALAGLWMYFDCFDESHRVSQEDASREGSFWHAIAHRREPDYGNSAYWYRQVGIHPVFPAVLEAARSVPGEGLRLGTKWDPLTFVDFCETAAGPRLSWALAVQRLEWEILFDYCARKRSV